MWIAILSTWFVAIASPGPDIVQIIRLGSRSRRAGLFCAVGIMVGNMLWILGTILGLSALMATIPAISIALFFIGAAILFWMGSQALRGGIRARAERQRGAVSSSGTQDSEPGETEFGDLFSLRAGFITNISNPKALLFFASVLAPMVGPDTSLGEKILLFAVLSIIGFLWFGSVAWMVSVPRWARTLERSGAWIDIVAGVVFILISLLLLAQGISLAVA